MTIIASGVLLACSQKQEPVREQLIKDTVVKEEPGTVVKPSLKIFTYGDVAKYTISVIMGHSPKIMSVHKDVDLYIVSYVRESDNQKFTYKVKFESNVAIWANVDGRWRNSGEDEKLTFEEVGEVLKIYTTYSDGSGGTDEFRK